MDISKVISDAIDNVSYQTSDGMVDLKDPNHLFLVREELKKHLSEDIINSVLNEDVDKRVSMLGKNAEIFETELKAVKKLAKFKTFIDNIPTGKPYIATLKTLNELTPGEIKDFAIGMGKDKGISAHTVKGAIDSKLFNIDAKGIGKGEVYLAWKVAGAKVQGGNQSFDLKVGGTAYEVKDYSGKKKSGAIRAGVEASVSKFKFWKQILLTVNIIQEMEKKGAWDILATSSDAFAPLLHIKDYLIDRVENKVKIVTGEYNKEDQKQTQNFYDIANSTLDSSDDSINQVVFRGPKHSPISYEIAPVNAKELKSGMKIDFASKSGEITQATAINYLKKIEYVRNPGAFAVDIQDAINKIIEKGEAKYWIIFRGTESAPQMKVIESKGSNFNYSVISQNGVKFKELE